MDASRRTECLPNTRADILKFIFDWVEDATSQQNLLWLHGLAGSGKSTLATTIANICGTSESSERSSSSIVMSTTGAIPHQSSGR